MFENALFTKNQAEMKRGLLTLPVAIAFQCSIVAAFVLAGVVSVTNLAPPETRAIFDVTWIAPPPPPPAGNPGGNNLPRQAAAVPRTPDKNDIVEPQKNETPSPANDVTGADGTGAVPGTGPKGDPGGDPNGIPDDGRQPIANTGPTDDPDVVKAVVAYYSPKPEYPPMALRMGLKGKVEVLLVVDENGDVADVQVLHSTNAVFDDAVRETVRRWKFTTPVDRRGQRVSVFIRKTIVFSF